MSRDSRILRVVQLSAVLAGVVANSLSDPNAYGLTDVQVHWVSLISVVLGTAAGYLGTSPLPGENDHRYVEPRPTIIVKED